MLLPPFYIFLHHLPYLCSPPLVFVPPPPTHSGTPKTCNMLPSLQVFDEELERAEKAIRAMADAGVDAAIVQDLGIVTLMRRVAPGLAVHGSTQVCGCSHHTGPGCSGAHAESGAASCLCTGAHRWRPQLLIQAAHRMLQCLQLACINSCGSCSLLQFAGRH